MPEIPNSAACGPYNNEYQHPEGNRRHDLLGANRFMLNVLKEDAAPGFESAAFDLAISQLDEFVRTSATLEVTPPESVDLVEGLNGLTVRVTNETGHKLPSGYSEGRVMWIEVVGRYNDEVVVSSGLWDQESASIQDDDSVRRYEGIAQNFATGTRNHLLLNNHWIEDNRIPPRGLTQHPDTDPVGDRYTLQGDGTWPHWDEVSYALPGAPDVQDATPADASDDQLQVSVRLLYLINTRSYIELLADDNTTTEVGTELAARFEALGWAAPVVLAEQELSIPISGFGGGDESSTSAGETGTPGTGSTSNNPTDPTDPSGDPTTTPGSEGSGTDTEASAGGSGGGGGGGCTVGGPEAPWGLSLLMLGLLFRRRRE